MPVAEASPDGEAEVEPGSSGTRPGGRTALTTQAVHAATLSLLAEHGYEAVSVDAVASVAGVHRTTVYRRWGSREALVAAALTANAGTQVLIPDEGDLRSDLVAMLRSVAENLASPLGGSLASAMVGQRDSPEITALSEHFWTTRFDAAAVIVDRAVQRGELRSGTDPRRLLEAAVAPVWFRCVVQRAEVDRRLIDDSVNAALTTA